MSKASERLRIKQALEQTGNSWLFRFWGEAEAKNLEKIRLDLEEFAKEYQRRFGERPDPFELLQVNPWKGAAFFHVDTLSASVEMKVLVWRILLGCEIARVEFRYEAGKPSFVKVVLRPPYGQGEEEYTSRHFADFWVLRHFGTSGVNDQLHLAGYYARAKA
jgi:hypothetical protein